MDPKAKSNIEEFSRRKKRQLIVTILVVPVAIFLVALKHSLTDPDMASWGPKVGFGVIIALVLFSFKNWRCPSCNRYLGKSGIPKYCPKCAAQLSE